MTSPSLRTNSLVETPTLAVCGAIGLPISAPTELSVGKSIAGIPSNCPTKAWNFPNMALVEVLLPESATPMKPSSGATMMKNGPISENALASDPAIPEKLKTEASRKIKTATRIGPQIWDQVVAKIFASCEPLTRYKSATTIQEAKMALPPTNGVQLKTAATVAPGASEDAAFT